MKMIDVPKAASDHFDESGPAWRETGWRGLKPGEEGGKRSAWFKCPNGHLGTLTLHDIAPDGVVSPSVGCPFSGCMFHDHIKLIGWE